MADNPSHPQDTSGQNAPLHAPEEPVPVIRAQNLTKTFNNVKAVDDVSLEIQPGTIFGFIGPSGSGKTTTIRLLTGYYRPTSGSIQIFGCSPQEFGRDFRERIGYMPQNFVLYPDLSVWENMNFAASIYGVDFPRQERLMELLRFVELDEHRHKRARNISGGMQRRLSLAATLIHHPELIFLDEPTGGVDPVLRFKFWEYFKVLQEEGATLFITTQYVSEASYCDVVGLMVKGRLLIVDTPKNLRLRAVGGEMVDVQFANKVRYSQIEDLRELPFVVQEVSKRSDNSARLVVDNASMAIPRLIRWFHAHDLEIEGIQEYAPPFDEVFVNLIKGNPDAR